MKINKIFLTQCILLLLIFSSINISATRISSNNFENKTDDEIKIIHITDPHVGGAGANDRFRDVLKYINGLNPDIIIIGGDLVDWASLGIPTPPFFRYGIPLNVGERNFKNFNRLINENLDEDIEILICPGNHDYYVGEKTWGGLRWHWFDRTFDHWERKPLRPVFKYELIWTLQNYHKFISSNERYGKRPDDYKLTCEDNLFISLNAGPISINPLFKEDINYILSHWKLILQDSWDGWCDKYISGTGLNDSQIDLVETWLTESTESNKIMFLHYPVFDEYQTILNNKENFTNLCEDNNVDLVLSGHMHTSHIYDSINKTSIDFEYHPYSENGLVCNKTYYVTTDDCGHSDAGYRVISINEDNVTVFRTQQVCDLANLFVDGPAEIHLYDSKGNHVGKNDNFRTEIEISGATYGNDKIKGSFISTYFGNNDYKFVIIGKEKGFVTLNLRIKMKNGQTQEFIYEKVPVTKGSKATLDVESDLTLYEIQNGNCLIKPTQIIKN